MRKLKFFAIISISLLLVFLYACNKGSDESEPVEASTQEQEQVKQSGEGQGEHAEGGEGEREEAGPRIAIEGTHDEIRKGSRLILSFDKESSYFIGTVENLTEKTLTRVHIEVHLSNGAELGPTEPIDLESGKKADVKLSTEGQSFEWWKAHAEVS